MTSPMPMTPDAMTALMDQLTEQNLQIALTFEKIVSELKRPDEDGAGLIKALEKLLAPLVTSSGQIMDNLGIPPTAS